jgi:hypothetical protein
MTLSGIEPATFRLVVQCINQLRHPVPRVSLGKQNIVRGNIFFEIRKKHKFAERNLFVRSAWWCIKLPLGPVGLKALTLQCVTINRLA